VLVAAAVCPHPPLLVPEATGASGAGDPELVRLRTACGCAVGSLRAANLDLIVAVGSAPRTAEYPPQATASLKEFGVPYPAPDVAVPDIPVPDVPVPDVPVPDVPVPDVPAPEAPVPDVPVLPLALTVGSWLLSSAGASTSDNVAYWGIAADAPPAECLELGGKLAAQAPWVGLLILGDGPGRRARNAPGAADPEASGYEDHVAAALAAADHAALAALEPSRDAELFTAGRPAWQVLAGAAAAATGAAFDAELGYAAAPFEVTYFVATWHRLGPR
jgi:hypothetical protein